MTGQAFLLPEIAEILSAGGIEDAVPEARWILEDAADAEQARSIAKRRARHEPLQYLLGKWEFYGLTMYVGEGVLIPRADTETLVEAVLTRLPDRSGQMIADLCTGSGCIALALAAHMEHTRFAGLERSAAALQYAEKNLALHRFPNVTFSCADVLDEAAAGQYHGLAAIVCNPPYLTEAEMQNLQEEVRYEPESALFGEPDGLHFYREITRLWRETLKPGGLLAYEVGYTQAAAVGEILSQNSFEQIERIRDLNGIERVVLGYRNP
ncbi:MAG: peptide chain release factor N(5)-glutamine methyltransferase [Oscillospiraceae bacterium]|nr:peptide chain release factor N(5)-glutamine methyltransferase [Oscillospiraceae bacterium]